MGLDREHYTPCGFCFVEYFRREDAESCMRFLNGTKLDERVIRTDWDAGFIEGRQFGRGRSGGQVRGSLDIIGTNTRTIISIYVIFVASLTPYRSGSSE